MPIHIYQHFKMNWGNYHATDAPILILLESYPLHQRSLHSGSGIVSELFLRNEPKLCCLWMRLLGEKNMLSIAPVIRGSPLLPEPAALFDQFFPCRKNVLGHSSFPDSMSYKQALTASSSMNCCPCQAGTVTGKPFKLTYPNPVQNRVQNR